MADRLVELLRADECSPLLSRLRKKVQRGESLTGRCRLSKLTRQQATRISELTGVSGRGGSIGVDLGLFSQIVINTGRFDSLESLVQLVCGEPLPNLRVARDEDSASWQRVWAHAEQLVGAWKISVSQSGGAEAGRTATLSESFTTDSLNEAIASMHKSGWLRRLTSRDPIAAISLFDQAFALLRLLPVRPVPVAVISAKHCGSAHALDDNTSLGRIVNHGEDGQPMTDMTTNTPLHVSTDGTAGPYIRVTVDQLDEVRRLLDSRSIVYWVEENVISMDGAPEIAVINLGRGGDAEAVQAVLDSRS